MKKIQALGLENLGPNPTFAIDLCEPGNTGKLLYSYFFNHKIKIKIHTS